MKAARWLLVAMALSASVATSASPQSDPGLQIPTTESDGGPERTTALDGRAFAALIRPMDNSSLTGTVKMVPAQEQGLTTVTISLVGAAPGTYFWHLHVGLCEEQGVLLGDPSEYQPIRVGDDGTGSIQQTMSFPPPSGGNYHVIIHQNADPNDEGNIVACGTLLEDGV